MRLKKVLHPDHLLGCTSPDITCVDVHQEGDKAFVEVLREEGLAQPLRDVIMYALACIPSSQEEPGMTGRPVSAAEGLAALARYMESVGRYTRHLTGSAMTSC